MEYAFDVAVVGSGSAGTTAALALRTAGRTVAIVDQRPFGGTCALRGCDPKKVLIAAARARSDAAAWTDLGVFDRAPALDWAKLMQFKRTFTDPVPAQRRKTYDDAGITALQGRAEFADRTTLTVGSDRIRAKHWVIASGAKELHVARGDDALLTSETFLELETLPQTLLFVGGGYIAFELAHVAARAGARVTILNDTPRPLPGFEPEMVDQLVRLTRAAGIDVQLETRVESVERDANGVRIHAQTAAGNREFRADDGVLAAGRVPDLDDLRIDAAGIERTKKGVAVNAYLQSTSNADVYAAGDAADGGGLPLTPVASHEGEVVAANVLRAQSREVDVRGLVSMVYSIPTLGSVGLTQAKAREEQVLVDVHTGDMSQWFSTRHVGANAGFYTTVVERESGKLLGATVLGPHAEEQINVLALAIRAGLRRNDIADALFAYPTGSSDLCYFME